MRQPPTSTLFPYTTLFRSSKHNIIPNEVKLQVTVRTTTDATRKQVLEAITRLVKTAADRKSTRLNSSHANISYAVFCLKKKNNGPTERWAHREHCYRCHAD